MEDLISIMKRVDLFRGLDEKQLGQLGIISQKETYRPGETICVQGSPGDKMFVISDGQVEIIVRDGKGASYSALYLGTGQVVGEMALVDDGTRSASVIAIEDETTVYSIPQDRFTELCKTDTAIGYLMMRNIAQDLSFKLRHHDFDPSDT